MRSRIYTGQLSHARTHKVEHSFVYSRHLYLLDLDELDALQRDSIWFGHNRFRPVAFYDRDYLYPDDTGVRQKVQRALSENDIRQPPARVMLVTALRQFGYVFNPVSFFYCLDEEDRIICVLAQVNNTFGESHLYVLKAEGENQIFQSEKMFHVSPFFPLGGRYQFFLSLPRETLSVKVTYLLDDQVAIEASFIARGDL